MTKLFAAFAVFLFLFTGAAASVFSQVSLSLEAEIQSMEKTATEKGVSAEKRHDALVRLARLRQLSGDIEGAAKNWLEAAAAIPGSVDDEALLSCAYCLAAMGEWDRASSALQPLLEKSARARFLDISINALKTGDVSLLSAISGDSQYAQMKSQIYFMLYKTSRVQAAEIWRQRLLTEFPDSPESRLVSDLASGGANKTQVLVRPSPFWLFIGGLDSLPIEKVETAASPPAASPTAAVEKAPTLQAPATVAAAPTIPQSSVSSFTAQPSVPQVVSPISPPSAGVKLQTGLYSQKENADLQIAKLKKAGFSPEIEQRGDKWAVIVFSNTDANRAIKDLKTAGFDSFPIK